MGDTETVKQKTGCGSMYLSLMDHPQVRATIKIGKSGTCVRAQVSAQAALIDIALAHGASKQEIIDALRGIKCHQSNEAAKTLSCPDAIATALEHFKED